MVEAKLRGDIHRKVYSFVYTSWT